MRDKESVTQIFILYVYEKPTAADCKSAFKRSSLFCLRISNPQERLADSRFLLRLADSRFLLRLADALQNANSGQAKRKQRTSGTRTAD